MDAGTFLKPTLTIVLLFLLAALSPAARADIIYVDDDGPADFTNIQSAIDNSNHGDTIVVSAGRYTGDGNRDIDFKGKAITVRSTDPSNPQIVDATIIDCEGTEEEPHRGFYFHSGEDASSILAGVVVTNGHLYRTSPGHGGGILCWDASPTITDCVITENGASGISILGDHARPTILNCVIKDNTSAFGGGISCYQSSPKIMNCRITNNVGGNGCGGIYCQSGSVRLANTIITGNFATDGDVGAICAYDRSNIRLSNCTIVGNSSYTEVGVVSINRDSSGTITNCIIWGNDGEPVREGVSCEVTVRYSNIGNEGGYKGQGNLNADPRFVDAGHWTDDPLRGGTWVDGDYHLLADSPCIDTGDPNYVAEPDETDLDGKPRVLDGDNDGVLVVDMGAYEYGSSPAPMYVRGDSNADNAIDIADAIFTLSYLFASGPVPTCLDAADANDDGAVDISDGVCILLNLFASEPAIPPPYPECGVDPTEDDLDCAEYQHCE